MIFLQKYEEQRLNLSSTILIKIHLHASAWCGRRLVGKGERRAAGERRRWKADGVRDPSGAGAPVRVIR